MWFVYAAMMDYANGAGAAITGTLFAMCVLCVAVLTVGFYGWGRWF